MKEAEESHASRMGAEGLGRRLARTRHVIGWVSGGWYVLPLSRCPNQVQPGNGGVLMDS
jgi:hypothetical protein